MNIGIVIERFLLWLKPEAGALIDLEDHFEFYDGYLMLNGQIRSFHVIVVMKIFSKPTSNEYKNTTEKEILFIFSINSRNRMLRQTDYLTSSTSYWWHLVWFFYDKCSSFYSYIPCNIPSKVDKEHLTTCNYMLRSVVTET